MSRLRVLGLVLLASSAVGACTGPAGQDDGPRLALVEPRSPVEGLVVDLEGRPLEGAEVASGEQRVRAGRDGRFTLQAPAGPSLVQVTAEGHLPRVEAVQPGRPLLSRLTARAGGTVSLRFGGDVMAGRRYYDADEDGRSADGLLRRGAGQAEHLALLEDVRPLLEGADLTVVNLESPLRDEPWFDPTRVRPAGFHPTKEFVFASSPAFAGALAEAGVDVVDLGNNHLFDALGEGVRSTLDALDDAGVRHYGAGADLDAAWEPARVEVAGSRFSFVGCTTILGDTEPLPYVATAARAGAAPCDEARLTAVVAAERASGATVVASVHGGFEYEREQSTNVRRLSQVARDAGALLVVDHHPHVVGGVAPEGDGLLAESLGNLLFDQEVWPTYPSYLLSADVRAGRLVRARTEPLLVEGYTPAPVVGRLADVSDRFAAGLLPDDRGTGGPVGAEALPGGPVRTGRAGAVLQPEQVRLLAPGWQVSRGQRRGLQVGQELLYSGSFEDEDTAPGGGGHLWQLGGPSRSLRPDATRTGRYGVRLLSPPDAALPTLLTTRNRVVLPDGDRRPLTLSAWTRGTAGSRLLAEVHWYPDTKGSSSRTVVEPVPVGADWSELRLEAEPPDGTVAAQVFLRLLPAAGERESAVAVDDVTLVQWAGRDTRPTLLHGAVRARGQAREAQFEVRQPAGGDRLPGWVSGAPLLPR